MEPGVNGCRGAGCQTRAEEDGKVLSRVTPRDQLVRTVEGIRLFSVVVVFLPAAVLK